MINPLVSVIVPFYNSIPFVLNSIKYLKNQTLTSFEVILVDDGSEDKRISSVKKAIKGDKRFSLITQEYKGAGGARNLGITHAKGDYVIFLDADDVYHRELLEKLYSSATKYNSDIVLCDASLENGERKKMINASQLSGDVAEIANIPEQIFQITYPAPWNKLIRRRLIHDFDLNFMELENANDLTFTFSALAAAVRISWVEEPLVMYSHTNPGSIQRSKDKDPTNIVKALEGLLNNLIDFGKFELFQDSYLKFFENTIRWNFKTFRNTSSRIKLLKGLVESQLFHHIATLNKDSLSPEIKDFLDQVQSLRASFVLKEQKIDIPLIKNKTKFTVIIPFYNVERYIFLPIESLKNQTFTDFSVILINDGSTDNSMENVQGIISEDPRFFIIEQCNQGLSVSRNLGLELANSDYVLFLDSDDALEPDTLEQLYNRLEQDSLDAIFFEAKAVNLYPLNDKQGKDRCRNLDLYYSRRGEYSKVMSGPEMMEEAFQYTEFLPSACLSATRLSFLKRNGIKFIPNILHEDNAYTFELLLKAERVSVLKKKFYQRTVRPESITTKKASIRNLWGYYTSFIKSQELLTEENNLSEDQKFAFQNTSYTFLNSVRLMWKDFSESQLFFLFLEKDKKFVFNKFVENYRNIANEVTFNKMAQPFQLNPNVEQLNVLPPKINNPEIILSQKEKILIKMKRKIFLSVRRVFSK